MSRISSSVVPPLALLLAAFTLSSCSEGAINTPADHVAEPPLPQLAVATAAVHPGRALAANCFQCHGTNGVASELKIAGESASEIISELNEMRAKPAGRNIMNVHAQGYTAAQIALIADYFAKQRA